MKTYVRILLLAICAFLVAPAQAGEAKFTMKYAGTVHDALDTVGTIIYSEAQASGSFGAKHILVISKFTPLIPIPPPDKPCDTGEVPMVMDYARSVTTYRNQNQMFVFWDRGWICATPGPAGKSSYRGGVTGHIVGGTGKFEGATGTVDSEFGGFDLAGPFVLEGPDFPIVGSFTGTVYGTVVFPD